MGFGGSGGGSGSIAGSSDVALNNPQDSQVLAYSSSTAKWTNQASAAASATPGEIALDSFAGANDDAKLAAAIAYGAAQTYKPLIKLGNRKYTFTQSIGQPYDGFALEGCGRGWQDAEQGVHHTAVSLNVTPTGANPAGYWINVTGAEAWNYYVAGIDFTSSNSATQFIRSASPSVLWASTFRDLTFQGFYGVLGNGSEGLSHDLITLDGGWGVYGSLSTPIHLNGSDSRALFPEGLNIAPGGVAGAGQYHIMLTSLGHTVFGPIYCNAFNGWRGIYISGSAQYGAGLILTGLVSEGKNATTPCDGNLIRVEGGRVVIRDCMVDSGMANPTSSEHGLIEVVGSDTQVIIDGLSAAHASGVAATTPVVYASGSPVVRVSNVMGFVRPGGTTWGSQLPIVQQATTGLIADHDGSIQIV